MHKRHISILTEENIKYFHIIILKLNLSFFDEIYFHLIFYSNFKFKVSIKVLGFFYKKYARTIQVKINNIF